MICFLSASKGTQRTNDAVDLGKGAEGNGSAATNNSTSGKASPKKKAHLKKFFKEEEDKKSKNTHDDARLTIPADGRADTVELEELQKQASSKRKVSKRVIISPLIYLSHIAFDFEVRFHSIVLVHMNTQLLRKIKEGVT